FRKSRSGYTGGRPRPRGDGAGIGIRSTSLTKVTSKDSCSNIGYLRTRWLGEPLCYGGSPLKGNAGAGPELLPASPYLRYDPPLSIVAAAEYDATSLDRLAFKKDASQKRYLIPGNLTEDQKARYLYLVHHEGETGAEQMLNRTLSNDRAEELLKANVPNE